MEKPAIVSGLLLGTCATILPLHAQWIQTSGPTGETVYALAANGSNPFAGTNGPAVERGDLLLAGAGEKCGGKRRMVGGVELYNGHFRSVAGGFGISVCWSCRHG
jgi:hypothetical protein